MINFIDSKIHTKNHFSPIFQISAYCAPVRSQRPPPPSCRRLPRTTRLALGGERQLPMALTRLNSLSMRSTAYRALDRR